ncbi:MAG TPA: response regulator [Rubrivivax sp.]|nr:response regulator [Rubrivivax sp.]
MGHQPPLIAVVDDDADVRHALQRLALAAGLAAQVYASGEAFLQSLDDHEPDCVVLDLHMPGLDGFAVQAALRRRGSTLPVLVITGDDRPATRRRAMALGARGYLRKPVDGEQLLAAIGAVLRAGAP